MCLSIFWSCSVTEQPKVTTSVQQRQAKFPTRSIHLFSIRGNFLQLSGIDVDPFRLYTADSSANVIHIIDKGGELFESVGRFGWHSGEFNSPSDVCTYQSVKLFIADTGNDRIQVYNLVDHSFNTFITQNIYEPLSRQNLRSPMGIAVDRRGNIFVADTMNSRIVKIDPFGMVTADFGGLGQLDAPQNITVDSQGYVYVCDSNNHRICKYDSNGRKVRSWGDEGSEKGQFKFPTGICHDRFGYIYVVDNMNRRVQVFNPDGYYQLEFSEKLVNPIDIAVDEDLKAYVTNVDSIEVFRIITESKSLPQDSDR